MYMIRGRCNIIRPVERIIVEVYFLIRSVSVKIEQDVLWLDHFDHLVNSNLKMLWDMPQANK